MKIKSIKTIEKPDTVYNLHIENNHNYLANDLVVSNCHQAKADVLRQLLNGAFAKCPIRWGLTGTIPKADHEAMALFSSLGPVVNHLSASQLQAKGVLAACHVNIMEMQDTREFKSYAEEHSWLVGDEERLEWIAGFVKRQQATGNTLVLTDRVEGGKLLEQLIPGSVFIYGGVGLDDRKETYDEIATADNKVIIATYGVAAVGINIPRIFNLILLEPGKSFVRVIQSIGRGIRKAADKDFVQIYDVCSSSKYSKKHATARKKFYKEANYPYVVEKVDWLAQKES